MVPPGKRVAKWREKICVCTGENGGKTLLQIRLRFPSTSTFHFHLSYLSLINTADADAFVLVQLDCQDQPSGLLILGKLFFLGHFRFESPARTDTDTEVVADRLPTEPGQLAAAAATADDNSATVTASSESDKHNHIWLYECQHNHFYYLCFPPYCAPGGLRSRLFPSSSESELSLGGESNNPFELLTHNPYLPAFVTEVIEDCQHDWNELGGSKCSFKRHSSSNPGATHCHKHHYERELLLQAAQQSVAQVASRLSALTAILVSEQTIHIRTEQRPQTEQLDQHQGPQFPSGQSFSIFDKSIMTNRERTPSPAIHVAATTPTTPSNNKLPLNAGKPIPQAVLVYHESAYSIVFRDHLRRQQKAIRQTSTLMEQSSHGDIGGNESSTGSGRPRAYKQHPANNTTRGGAAYKTIMEETDMGYESTGSRGSTHSGGGESSSSVTSFRGGSSHPTRHNNNNNNNNNKVPLSELQPVVVANFQPVIQPLEPLELNSSNIFEPLLDADPSSLEMTEAEQEVVELLRKEQAVVKTIRNADWTAFLQKFTPEEEGGWGKHEHHPSRRTHHGESGGDNSDMKYPFNSFVTSTSLLPSCGKKMRCFGSTNEYAVGVVFALPSTYPDNSSEDEAARRTKTWSWPSGYSAKTEFNIDDHGNLINGREEALVPLSGLRQMNHSYMHDKDYVVGGRLVIGGLSTIPYNEVYIRVGGPGRISCGMDVSSGKNCNDADGTGRSLDHGIGIPVALFVREAGYGHLVRLFRTRARFASIFGVDAAHGIPLLYISPELGVRVFTQKLQHQVLKVMAWDLNPFQNPSLAHKTGIDNTSEPFLQQKLEELLDLDDDDMKQVLTPEEMARIAGGFGATDESVANLLHQAMQRDIMEKKSDPLTDSGHNLQDLVNEGLAFALRANDYHTSRQLLILYTLVAAKRHGRSDSINLLESDEGYQSDTSKASSSSKWRDAQTDSIVEKIGGSDGTSTLGKEYVPPPPPPPPLDTDRLRSATNSDGLLAVLGAAQVLRAMQDGSAKRRVKESIDAIEEWIENGEQSVAFRVASWRDQRAAQGDLKIAMENDSNFMAFISNKAISNRTKFAKQLREAAEVTEFDSLRFLKAIHSALTQMHSPCLRLELLQYILGLDNRYSVAHVTRSVELAATCLNLSETDVFNNDDQNNKAIL